MAIDIARALSPKFALDHISLEYYIMTKSRQTISTVY